MYQNKKQDDIRKLPYNRKLILPKNPSYKILTVTLYIHIYSFTGACLSLTLMLCDLTVIVGSQKFNTILKLVYQVLTGTDTECLTKTTDSKYESLNSSWLTWRSSSVNTDRSLCTRVEQYTRPFSCLHPLCRQTSTASFSGLPSLWSSLSLVFLVSGLPCLLSSLSPVFLVSGLPCLWSSLSPVFLVSGLPCLWSSLSSNCNCNRANAGGGEGLELRLIV